MGRLIQRKNGTCINLNFRIFLTMHSRRKMQLVVLSLLSVGMQYCISVSWKGKASASLTLSFCRRIQNTVKRIAGFELMIILHVVVVNFLFIGVKLITMATYLLWIHDKFFLTIVKYLMIYIQFIVREMIT